MKRNYDENAATKTNTIGILTDFDQPYQSVPEDQ
jgi:hypothetical protein